MLPFIDDPRNFYVPDDVGLQRSLRNLGVIVRETRYPYLRTPYARPLRDHWRYLRNLVSPRSTVVPTPSGAAAWRWSPRSRPRTQTPGQLPAGRRFR